MHAQSRVPTIDQLIELKRPGGVALSPDGTKVMLHRHRDQLGRQRVRNRNLHCRYDERVAAAADPREEVEQCAGVVA